MMTSKERLWRIFRGEDVDRPAFKLWGLSIGQSMMAPAYRPVYERALELTDTMEEIYSPLNVFFGSDPQCKIWWEDKPLEGTEWVDRYTYYQIGDRTLRSIFRYSTIGSPGYDMEHMIKEPEDLKALLSVPYKPYPIDTDLYYRAVEKVGDKGLVMFGLDHAAYAVCRKIGSERFALMCIDDRDLIKEAVYTYAKRIRDHVKAVLDTGIRPIFSWVGPELIIPPLVRMDEFEEFVFEVDKPLCDLIHDAGGYVWVHCHGRVGKLLKRFAEMGVDVLNPIEPPPQGDVTLKEAVELVGNSMGLEGNIEMASLQLSRPEELKEQIRQAVEEGSQSKRFILGPTAGYMEYPLPTEQYIQNLMVYLEYGYECVSKVKY